MFRAFQDSALTRLSKGQARSVGNAALAASASAVFPSDNLRRRVGPERATSVTGEGLAHEGERCCISTASSGILEDLTRYLCDSAGHNRLRAGPMSA